MKKILMALIVAGSAYFSAEAQTMPIACGKPQDKVCRMSKNGVSCYKTKYAENFAVCKGDLGYYICCETPNNTNSTHPALPVDDVATYRQQNSSSYDMQSATTDQEVADNNASDMIAPQSQSYPSYSANVATTYEGYYPKHYIKACVNSDNVAMENRAPYNGCPSPAYDGPDRNKERNINVSTPNANAPLAPITGNGY